jgi:hypothetical protein
MDGMEKYQDLRYSDRSSLFEDNAGNLLTAEEVDELSAWEIEERHIHVSEV